MSDGAIHLDFLSEGSFVNAAELTPTESDAALPLRMLAGPASFTTKMGTRGSPSASSKAADERFTLQLRARPKTPALQWARYGHFHYFIPVVTGKTYRIGSIFQKDGSAAAMAVREE